MLILGIETSCDETSVAIVLNGTEVLSNCTISSQKAFARHGGVIPEEAARKQVECIVAITESALAGADVSMSEIDAIAVTKGPGLLGSLLVGTTAARTLASLYSKPLIGVHHTLGHLSSTWLEAESEPEFPCLTLSASGGHTDLWYRQSHTTGALIGRTRDDAAGEAFDKGASMLGLPYPGGPSISKAAEDGDVSAYTFPKPLSGEDGFDYSFSGLKTALKYTIRDEQESLDSRISDLAASYQHALCMHLVSKLKKAANEYSDAKEIHLVGGVSANSHLRELVQSEIPQVGLRCPRKISFCTDNAAMICSAAYFLVQEKGDGAYERFETTASLPLAKI